MLEPKESRVLGEDYRTKHKRCKMAGDCSKGWLTGGAEKERGRARLPKASQE